MQFAVFTFEIFFFDFCLSAPSRWIHTTQLQVPDLRSDRCLLVRQTELKQEGDCY